MNTGRYTRIRTRQHSDPLFPPHPSRNAFAIALAHSTIYTQQHSIHRFAESCHSSNLHSTSLHPTFKYINEYYNLHTHQRCLKSHFRSESPTSRFTTTFLHPTRHLLFIFPLSQPHLLSFHLFFLFWTCGKRSRLILCGRHLSYPFLLSSFHSLHHHTAQSIPSPFTRLKTNTPYPSQHFTPKASQTLSFTTTKETVCEASGSILYPRAYTLRDETRVTQQSPPYEPPRRSNNSRRTRLRHRNHLLNAPVHCTALLYSALHCNAEQ